MSDRSDRLMEFLTTEGFRPKLRDDGDIAFCYEGGYYGIRFDPKDDQYLALIYPNFWELKTDEDRARGFRAANRATDRIKMVKVIVDERGANLWASVEFLAEGTAAFEFAFYRALFLIQAGVKRFREEWRALEEPAETQMTLPLGHIRRFQHGN